MRKQLPRSDSGSPETSPLKARFIWEVRADFQRRSFLNSIFPAKNYRRKKSGGGGELNWPFPAQERDPVPVTPTSDTSGMQSGQGYPCQEKWRRAFQKPVGRGKSRNEGENSSGTREEKELSGRVRHVPTSAFRVRISEAKSAQ